ncbi:MAG TPA: hypothetical protein VL422_11145 [Miltoncostaea sp.]|nr:hypothetical protein [Miltoncostaea sp.]
MLRRRGLVAALAAAAALAAGAPQAGATTFNCPVSASGGYIGCVTVAAPSYESVKANAATGTPYRFQLVRPSDGARWGWWQWSDTSPHFPGISIPSGFVTGQVDNLGSGTPTYLVEMF